MDSEALNLSKKGIVLQNLSETVPHYVFWKDIHSVYMGCNEIFAKAAGLNEPSDIVGKTDYDLPWSKEESDWYRQCDRQVMDKAEPWLNIEETQLHADGTQTYVLTNKIPLRNEQNEVIGILGTYVDVTEEKNQKTQIHIQNAALDSVANGIVITDKKGSIIWANPAVGNLTGYSLEELKDQNPRLLRSGKHPDDFYKEMWETIARGDVWRGEVINQKKDGTHYTEEMSITPVKNRDKAIEYYIAIKADVTDRKRLEQELNQAQRLESIGQLAAGLAHEINTPIQFVGDNTNFIKTSCEDVQVILDEVKTLLELRNQNAPANDIGTQIDQLGKACDEADLDFLTEEIPIAFQQTLEGVDQISTIVKSMKEFSHPESKEREAIDIAGAIETTINVTRNEWRPVAEVSTDYDSDLPQVPCFVADFNLCILNIIANAAHAIAESLNPKDTTPKGVIQITTRKVDEFAEIRISDTGTGIPDSVLPKIFDQFFTTREVGKGTGQGLHIVYSSVVNKHNGSIDVETELGKGTTFIIKLPLK